MKNMREIFDGYNEIFSKWSNQKLKINDLEKEILYLEADLKVERRANTAIMDDEIEKARLGLKDAEALVIRLEENESSEGIGQQLDQVGKEAQASKDFYDYVINTFEEQMKLWEVDYSGYSLRIDNLRERLIVERAILDFYSAELAEWKAKIHTALKKVS